MTDETSAPGWPRHRSLVATATSGTVVAAIVAGLAFTSTGYTAQKLDLGDGAVWVANGAQQAVGRANPEVLELNTVIRTGGQTSRSCSAARSVLVVDHANATVQIVDPADSSLGEPIALPPEEPQVFAGGRPRRHPRRGHRASCGSSRSASSPTSTRASPTSLSLGLDSVVAVTPDGTLFAYSAEVGEVFRVDAARTDEVDARWATGLGDVDDVQVTAVGDTWAVLDPDGRRIALERGVVDLSDFAEVGEDLVLQEPADDGDRILVGSETGLLSVPLSGADVVPRRRRRGRHAGAPFSSTAASTPPGDRGRPGVAARRRAERRIRSTAPPRALSTSPPTSTVSCSTTRVAERPGRFKTKPS